MRALGSIVLPALAVTAMSTATVQTTQPLVGSCQCKSDFMNIMPGAEGTAMVSAARYALDGDNKNTTIFTSNVMFDNKGVGKLLNRNGVTIQEGKPITAYIGKQANWVLKIRDGQTAGYSADGINQIVAGESIGKSIHWAAAPTGPDTMIIKYEVK